MEPLQVDSVELSGSTVIEASAGTGKTYTITSLVLRLLLESGLSIEQILVVTYTRAATAELRDRIGKRLAAALACAQGRASEDDPFLRALCQRAAQATSPEQVERKLQRALSDIDQAPVLTIHGFCQRVLRDNAFESGSGFSFELTAHAAPIFDEIADDYYIAQLFDTDPARAKLLCSEADTLRALAVRAGAFAGARFIPEQVEQPDLSPDRWLRAHEACRALWQRESAAICAQVAALKGIQKPHFARWCQLMEELMAGGKPGFAGGELAKGFVNFTRSGVLAKAKGPVHMHPFFDAAEQLREEDLRLSAAMDREKVAFRAGFVRYLQTELERRARDTDVRTFDGLLTELSRALSSQRAEPLLRALRSKYRAALVDEFQDTDPSQYAMFRRIFAEGRLPLFLIGDPKQAIYAFRGADVQAYLWARHDAGAKVFTLGVNRRSDQELVNALNQLYAQVSSPFASDQIQYLPVTVPSDASGRFLPCDERAAVDLALVEGGGGEEAQRREIARRVALDIGALLTSGARRLERERGQRQHRALTASDVAVLCRTNREASEVQLSLSELGIASVQSGDASVFDSEDAGHLERVLTALAHPTDPRALRSFLCSIYGGVSADQLLQLEHDDAAWDAHASRFRELSELFVTRGFTQALRALCAMYTVEELLLARPDGLRRITNLQHLGELLSEVSLTERLGPLGLLRWLETARSDAQARTELTGDSHELRLESGDNAVKLTTVHKSKGLEYPVVYCPFLYKPASLRNDDKELVRFHDPAAGGVLTLDLGSEQRKTHLALAEQEALAEALRLLYVALTRAKHRVVLVLPLQRPQAQSALVYTLLGGGDVDQVKAQLQSLSTPDQLRGWLEQRAAHSAGALSVRMLPTRRERVPGPAAGSLRVSSDTLEARPIRRSLDASTRTASFSALIAGRPLLHEALDEPVSDDSEAPAAAAAPSPLTLEPFPRGAAPGRLIHEVLEHAAFDGQPEAWRASTERVLRARGADLTLLDVLVTALAEIVSTPLDGAGLTLSALSSRARVNELEFLFPVQATLTARSLGKVLRAHDAPSAQPSYVRRLEALPFEALRGYLRGFIDMVFEHHGRFYVVDYKSNYLGPLPSDYTREPLLQAMSEHHYFLQYHLYTLALHRHLKQRLPGYHYEQHMGGVYYLFLRGMAPAHAQGTGVFFERPSAALIHALDRAMAGQDAPRAEAS